MDSLLNHTRPPVFCPGCSHERSLHALDTAFQKMGLRGNEVAIVSDIGCSGLFDVYFNTHAMHGLHGRALTYVAGIKMACPELTVVVTMGDGCIGIGSAHLLAACRRNLNLTLLILNNFNFGMTGGQFSCTTPSEASVASGFLNVLESPMDICSVAAAAGAPYVARASIYRKDIAEILVRAISFEGFSLVDLWGLCTGRYTKRNPMSLREIETSINKLPPFDGPVAANARREYGDHYREKMSLQSGGLDMTGIEVNFASLLKARREVVLIGSAGDRIQSAGALLAFAAISAGMHATQKNDYDITVLRGQSVSEVIISPEPVVFTGVEKPDVIVAISQEGVARHKDIFLKAGGNTRIIMAKGLEIPATSARISEIDFSAFSIAKTERAIAALAFLARAGDPITAEMLDSSLRQTLTGKELQAALAVMERTDTLSAEERIK
ncbi:MAG TPA: thiamine pyrophosphate-dependent enzyme [Syntrophales bacterium]|nr:thiamine pyrophosphate-dependent enzyme [Syntrophales bacterium]